MYLLARISLVLAVAGAVASLSVVAVVGWPASGYLALVLLAGHVFLRRRGQALTTLGSARWASEGDLRRAGAMGVESGLILGRLPKGLRSRGASLRKLFDLRVSAKDACLAFWAAFRQGSDEFVRLSRAVHIAVFGPTGGGKGVSCVIPFLLTCPDSCVVVDFKGENFLKTARQRRKWFGHQIVALDPFGVVTKRSDTFNPLDFIPEDSPYALDYCNALANSLVVRGDDERERHWNDSAEAWIAAVLATVVKYGGRENARSLQTVRDVLSHPQRLELAVKLMCESDAWGGMLARMGGQLLHFVEKEKSSTLTTVGRHLRFLDTLAVAESTKASTFDPAKLRSGRMTIFLVLPPEHMRAQSALLRVWIGSLLKAVVAGGLQERNKVHFILDEAASLGHLEAIDDSVDKYRGYGVRMQFYFQSLGQVRKNFPDGQEQTLLSNTTQVFFGVNDNATADYVSARLGESTIIVDSGGTSSGSSTQWSESVQPSTGGGTSYNRSSNWQQQARKLLKPEEIMTLPGRTAIAFTPGAPPVCTTLLRYYEEGRGFGRQRGIVKRTSKAVGVLITSVTLCAASLLLAAELVGAANRRPQPAGVAPNHRSVKQAPAKQRVFTNETGRRSPHGAVQRGRR